MPGDHWLSFITPGNAGEPKSTSFQLANGMWLAQFSNEIYDIIGMERKGTNWFNLATTFSLINRTNSFVAFNSIAKQNHFIELSGYQIRLGRLKYNSHFMDRRIKKESKYRYDNYYNRYVLIQAVSHGAICSIHVWG